MCLNADSFQVSSFALAFKHVSFLAAGSTLTYSLCTKKETAVTIYTSNLWLYVYVKHVCVKFCYGANLKYPNASFTANSIELNSRAGVSYANGYK